jgi:ribonuclease HI
VGAPPDAPVIKMNVDGTFKKESGRVAIGAIATDAGGQPLSALWSCLHSCRDAEEAEAMACLEGVKLGRRWPDCPIVLESDCSQIIDKLQAGSLDRSLVAPIVCDVVMECSLLLSVSFSKVRREQNKAAHELAQLAMRSEVVRVSSENVPASILPAVYSDSP